MTKRMTRVMTTPTMPPPIGIGRPPMPPPPPPPSIPPGSWKPPPPLWPRISRTCPGSSRAPRRKPTCPWSLRVSGSPSPWPAVGVSEPLRERLRADARSEQQRPAEPLVVLRAEALDVVHLVDVDHARRPRIRDRDVGVLAVRDRDHPAHHARANQVDGDVGEGDRHHLVERIGLTRSQVVRELRIHGVFAAAPLDLLGQGEPDV